MDRRRALLAALCLVSWRPAAAADRARRIGILFPGERVHILEQIALMRTELKALGFVEGRDVVIEWRAAQWNEKALPALMDELLRDGADVILTTSTGATRIARQATSKVPIVTIVGEPQRSGFAASIAKPGGNVTGLSLGSYDVARKQIEILRMFRRELDEACFLRRSRDVDQDSVKTDEAAAHDAGLAYQSVSIAAAAEAEAAFQVLHKRGAKACIVDPQLEGALGAGFLAEIAARHGIAAAGYRKDWVVAGGLASFALVHHDVVRTEMTLVAQVLRGARPAEIPFQLPDAYELGVNRATAKRLGLEVPTDLLLRATKIVD